ncbi:MAG: tetratricopeptide repeat protein [Cyanobacteriota bacterium]|nr:tetratricopeptide repeat protein [Cyanobacteriota bacterium]
MGDEERSPEFHLECSAIGDRFYHRGNLEGAIAQYRECLKFEQDFLVAKYNLGVALGNFGKYPEAIAIAHILIPAGIRI